MMLILRKEYWIKRKRIMKKNCFYFGLVFAILAGCNKTGTPSEENLLPDENEKSGYTVLTASMDNTKVSIGTDHKSLTWVKGDEISVWTSKNRFVTFSNEETGALDKFAATLDEGESVSGYAVYPAGGHAYDGTTLSLDLADTFAWVENQTRMPMVAEVSGASLAFHHAGGVMDFTLSGIPSNATAFKFVTNNGLGINGTFDLSSGTISAPSESSQNEVTVTFSAGTASSMRFLIPVPVGVYDDFTISAYAGESQLAKTVRTVKSTANGIEASRALYFSLAFPGTDIYAAPTAAGTKTGSDASNPATLDKALAMAEDGDEIHLAAGTYSGAFSVTKNVTLQGTDKTTTILDGGGTELPINVSAAGDSGNKVYIKDLTVQNGSGGAGGGIFIGTSAFAEIDNCIITGNTATIGGGGLDNGGTTVVSNTTFSANTCTHASNGGGAIWNMENTGNLTLNNCTFTGNTATYNGGAVYNKGVLISNDCIYTSNVATTNNGGVFNNSPSGIVYVNGGTISGNSAKTSGVIYNDSAGKATFDGVNITGNSAPGHGGALRHWSNTSGGYIKAINCYISENKVTGTGSGGAIQISGNYGSGQFINCAIVNNSITAGSGSGGAAQISGSYATGLFINCTISNNSTTGYAGAVHMANNSVNSKCDFVNCTVTGNTAVQSSYTLHKQTNNPFSAYNSIIVGNTNNSANCNQEISAGSTIKSCVTNNAQTTTLQLYLFAADGTKGTTDYAPVSNILGSLSTDVYPLAAGEGNPARIGGMSTAELTTLAGTLGIDSAILLKDQKGNSRSGKTMMGAYVGD